MKVSEQSLFKLSLLRRHYWSSHYHFGQIYEQSYWSILTYRGELIICYYYRQTSWVSIELPHLDKYHLMYNLYTQKYRGNTVKLNQNLNLVSWRYYWKKRSEMLAVILLMTFIGIFKLCLAHIYKIRIAREPHCGESLKVKSKKFAPQNRGYILEKTRLKTLFFSFARISHIC